MRLLFSTRDLEIAGHPVEGLPLLINDEGGPLQPVQDFIIHILMENGRTRSKLTWEAIGRRLYDYFAFLNANGLQWDDKSAPPGASPLSRYRDWSAGTLRLAPTTINKRLALVVRFYEWARRHGYIDRLPFTYRQIYSSTGRGVLAHVQRHAKVSQHAAVLLREHKGPIRILTAEQVQQSRKFLSNPTHRLLFELMLRSGLRSCEARTLPASYVSDPNGREDIRPGQLIRVDLDPRDMEIKYERPRSIDVPWDLMRELAAYKALERRSRLAQAGHDHPSLILSSTGGPVARTSLVGIFSGLSRRVGFKVSAHMLRHTYATYTLAALRRKPDFSGEPLLYVRDRLGHSDVQTTARYLHLINQMEAQLVLRHEDFVDSMFAIGCGA